MGLEECNNQIKLIKEKFRIKRQLKAELNTIEEKLQNQIIRKEQLSEILFKEEKDVEIIKGKSAASLFHKIIGDWDEKLMKEKYEYKVANKKVEECDNAIEEIQKELSGIKKELKEFCELDMQYESLLKIKESLISEIKDENSVLVLELVQEQKKLEEKSVKLKEIYRTGEQLFYLIEAMLGDVSDAADFSGADTLTGGVFSSLVSNSSIDDSNDKVYDIGALLREFNKGLITTEVPYIDINTMDFYINSDSIDTYREYYHIHGRMYYIYKVVSGEPSGGLIEGVSEKVLKARDKVHGALCGLKFNLDDIEEKLIDVKLRKRELLESV